MDESSRKARERILAADYRQSRDIALDLTLDFNGATSERGRYLYHSNGLFEEAEIRKGIYNKRYRYGLINPYQNLSNCREFLFFTKPDLNIFERTDSGMVKASLKMNDDLSAYSFWTEMEKKFPEVLQCLQITCGNSSGIAVDPFNHLLENTVQSNIDVPSISSELIETPSNMYGVNFGYRGSSEASDDGFDFSLEFKDTKFLPVYHFFKAYEEYEKLKHHGVIGPWIGHIMNKVLHDQYCIYKFLTLDDMETIVYYAKYYGVKSKNLPRDAFGNVNFDNGLSYSVEFNAAFVEDMNPEILIDFNYISYEYWKTKRHTINIYDAVGDRVNMTPAQSAIVALETDGESKYRVFGFNDTYPVNGDIKPGYDEKGNQLNSVSRLTKTPGKYAYKLKWKGDDLL